MNLETHSEKQLNNFKMLDTMKYVAAILVICTHCQPIFSNRPADYFLQSIICRIAVPFFFVSSAYFVRRGIENRPNYLKNYLRALGRSYLLWSIVFIPIGWAWTQQNLQLANNLLPLALIMGIVHVGIYYHLWYIPALILSLFAVNLLLKKFSYKLVFLISCCLYLFGSLETYYGLLPAGFFKEFFDLFIQVLFTTRSGLFYGMIFTAIGFLIYDFQSKLQNYLKYLPALTAVSAGLLIAEGIFLYDFQRLDMNFLLALVPFSFCFFLWILSFSIVPQFDTKKLRDLSKYYYFLHPISVVIIEEMGKALEVSLLQSGILSLLLVVLLTHGLSLLLIKVQNQPHKYLNIVGALFLILIMTFTIASLVFAFKKEAIIIKFEFVPCIFVFSSYVLYFLLHKRNERKQLLKVGLNA